MLIGEYSHTLDVKGRINFPARLREDLGERFYITKGLDDCLFVYSEEEWQSLAAHIRTLPFAKAKDVQRYFFGGASEAEPDKQGRVNIPPHLRAHAKLDKDVVIVGAMVRAEIWDKQRWQERLDGMSSSSIENIIDTVDF